MTMRRLASVTAIAALFAMSLNSGGAAAGRTEEYMAGFMGDVVGYCAESSPNDENIGVVCMSATAGTAYKVTVTDVTGEKVGFWHEFDDADGNCVGTEGQPTDECEHTAAHCGTSSFLVAPPGTKQIAIILDGPLFGPLDCFVDGPQDAVGIATNGTVTVTP